MDSEKSLNPSSLLDLKAELHKKYESFRKAKVSQKPDSSKPTTFKLKVELVSKDKKVIPKQELKSPKIDDEEQQALEKSRKALEAKAKLYEKITSNHILIDDEESEKYLVDFQRKVLYDTCMPEKAKSVSSKPPVEQNHEASHSPKLPSDAVPKKPVIIDTQKGKIQEENQAEQPVHYQNVQFNEVREHGIGYFAFSTDETTRKQQMEEINKIHREGIEQIAANKKIQRKRKALLEARLAKVCERRNIDKSIVQTYTKTEDTGPNDEQDVDLSSIPLPETSEEPPKKEAKIRPWDVGKTDFPAFVPEKSKTRSQNDWVQERRSERPSEFAPPSYY